MCLSNSVVSFGDIICSVANLFSVVQRGLFVVFFALFVSVQIGLITETSISSGYCSIFDLFYIHFVFQEEVFWVYWHCGL